MRLVWIGAVLGWIGMTLAGCATSEGLPKPLATVNTIQPVEENRSIEYKIQESNQSSEKFVQNVETPLAKTLSLPSEELIQAEPIVHDETKVVELQPQIIHVELPKPLVNVDKSKAYQKPTHPVKLPKIKNNVKTKLQDHNGSLVNHKLPLQSEYIKVPSQSGDERILIGSIEPVRLIPGNFIMHARIDTGAKTTSLHAQNLKIIERDGKSWAHFEIRGKEFERKIHKFIRIKRHGKAAQRRPVIKMRIILGDVSQSVYVTLTDRSKFRYKVLVGRNFLNDLYVVDVAEKNLTHPIEYKKK